MVLTVESHLTRLSSVLASFERLEGECYREVVSDEVKQANYHSSLPFLCDKLKGD